MLQKWLFGSGRAATFAEKTEAGAAEQQQQAGGRQRNGSQADIRVQRLSIVAGKFHRLGGSQKGQRGARPETGSAAATVVIRAQREGLFGSGPIQSGPDVDRGRSQR